MTDPKSQRRTQSVEAGSSSLAFLTPAEAETLRRRFGVDMIASVSEEDDPLRRMARRLSALKKNRKR